MQVLDRVTVNDNWITGTFIFLLLLLFILKRMNPIKLNELSKAFFLKGFIEREVEDKSWVFSLFWVFLFLFSSLVLSVSVVLVIKDFSPDQLLNFLFLLQIFMGIVSYFAIAALLDFLLMTLFKINIDLRYFIKSKSIYYYNSALFLLPVAILTNYSLPNSYALLFAFGALFLTSIILIIINNKNLILNKLFYFILYLCALKIVPLLIIYKIIS